MSVNQTMPQEISHSKCELRFLEFEAGYLKNHEELLKTVETLSKHLDEVKAKQARIFIVYKFLHLI
jgi:hypothetical protein